MKVLYTPHHQPHIPPAEIFEGRPVVHQEQPARVENILQAVHNVYEVEELTDVVPVPDKILKTIHEPDYLAFLRQSQDSLTERWIYPSVFPPQRSVQPRYTHQLAQHGLYSFDMFTPLNKDTWQTAYRAAGIAYQAVKQVIKNPTQPIYCLIRPPGHHAQSSQMGGYCYLNNAAIAAQTAVYEGVKKVAILDVDFHHGNGTQHIFYRRSDVLTVSIHADPHQRFPYFTGFVNEIGAETGKNYNRNIPLPLGTNNSHYQQVLVSAVNTIADFQPSWLVISFGTDTHHSDPIGGFKLSTAYFHSMAATIAELNLPTVILQEGGYNTQAIGDNVVSFLSGFER